MMSLLASRERFCLHADVSRADDKAAACADATHVGKMCCTHLDKAEAIQYPQKKKYRADFEPGGKLAVCKSATDSTYLSIVVPSYSC